MDFDNVYTIGKKNEYSTKKVQTVSLQPMSPLYPVKLKIAVNSRPLTAVRSVEQIVPNFRRKSFNIPLFPYLLEYFLAVFWQKIYILMGFYQKIIFKLNIMSIC